MEAHYPQVTARTAISAAEYIWGLHEGMTALPSKDIFEDWKYQIDKIASDAMSHELHKIPFRTNKVGSEGDKEIFHAGEAASSVKGIHGLEFFPDRWGVSDVVEGTSLAASNKPGACSVLAVTEPGGILPDSAELIFILVDLNDLVEREAYPFWILTQKRIVDAIDRETIDQSIKDNLQDLFLNSIQTKELFLVIDNIRTSLSIITKAGYKPVIFFTRFDRIGRLITSDLFCILESLRDTTNRNLSYIFTTFRELTNWSKSLERHPSLSLLMETIYLKPVSSRDAKIVLKANIKHFNLKLSNNQIDSLLMLAGGNIQLIRLFSLALIHYFHHHPNEKVIDIRKIIFSDERVMLHCDELWESLSEDEQLIACKIIQHIAVSQADKKTAQYLWDTGLVEGETIFSPLFEYYLKNKLQPEILESQTNDFSKKEHALFNLFTNSLDEVIDRNTIIETVWPEEKEFGVSDWAIDRLVSRFRNKLKKQQSHFELVTVKTRGFKMVDNQSKSADKSFLNDF